MTRSRLSRLTSGCLAVTAVVEVDSNYLSAGRGRHPITRLGSLSVGVSGLHDVTGRLFGTSASVNEDLFRLGYPDTRDYESAGVHGRALVGAFQALDLLRFVENHTPDSLLPQEPYGTHVARAPMQLPMVA